ncbi:hypothetical protein TrST_g6986 [Triparma strigata]|uniref:Acyltransferase n=1 Tax=Triparma strigata TaxID=1606541 RepID=A0A9W7B164_9STRA|nr:hypothetical protein TrST_g6986 [Triparma strigata]
MPTYTHSNASFTTSAAALLVSNGMLASILSIFVLSIYYYPRAALLYVWLPYYTIGFVSKWSTRDGLQWHWFALNFPVFAILRAHIGLTLEVSKNFSQEEKKKDAKFIFAIFPHGVGSDFRVLLQGMLPSLAPNIHAKIRSLAASVLFVLPIIREITLFTGCIDASRSVANRALKNGRSLIILPGGEAEQLMTKRGVEKIYLKSRKGFIKLAMRHGVPVVPCYVFGSNDLFHTSEILAGPRQWLVKNLGVCIPMTWGYLGTLCPLPVKNTICFGDPVEYKCKVDGEPTDEELNAAHADFCEKIKALFDSKKKIYGCEDRELIIV